MSFYETFATDTKLESVEGIDLDYGASGVIKIHRAGGANKKFATVLNAKMAPYRRQLANGSMDEAVATKLMAEIYAEAVILGWVGVKGRDGKELKFTKENVVKLLVDLPELFKDIQEQATTIANFRASNIEADEKNLSAS